MRAGGFMKNKKTKIIISAVLLAFAFTFLIGNNVSAEGIYTFSDGDSKKVITFGQGKDCETFWISLPSKNSVSTVNLDISGDIQQSKLDLVFLIDTSGSMDAEWNDVCTYKDNIINTLEAKDGVNIQATVYGLGKTRSCATEKTSCSGGEEGWMEGIIWASENYGWRQNAIRAIIAISDANNNSSLKTETFRIAKENNVIIYGLFSYDSYEIDPKDDMEKISKETNGYAVEFKNYKDLEVIMGDAANKALSGLSLKVGGTEVWGHLEKMMNKQSVGGTESSAFVKALNDYSKQHCTSYPCNVPIEICSSKSVKGDLTLSYLRISMTPVISGPCQNLVPCTDDCKLSDIFVMIQNIVNCLVFISTIICLLFLVIGGLLYIFSLGNPENLTKAKNTILWALGGLALVFLAWLIVNTVMQFMGVGGGFLMWSSVG
jgi:hypothetical protein